mmetsp:Transcript_4894/g.14593  ORF Transcript_4894/g.14593 Transcript_4894/m.14593 type:complete len:273 (-) Transcript_4894:354-1172(-)
MRRWHADDGYFLSASNLSLSSRPCARLGAQPSPCPRTSGQSSGPRRHPGAGTSSGQYGSMPVTSRPIGGCGVQSSWVPHKAAPFSARRLRQRSGAPSFESPSSFGSLWTHALGGLQWTVAAGAMANDSPWMDCGCARVSSLGWPPCPCTCSTLRGHATSLCREQKGTAAAGLPTPTCGTPQGATLHGRSWRSVSCPRYPERSALPAMAFASVPRGMLASARSTQGNGKGSRRHSQRQRRQHPPLQEWLGLLLGDSRTLTLSGSACPLLHSQP